jgi:2-phosphosulfolactate phosphatase
MRLDVFLTPNELIPGEIAGRTVVVLDVLRATSTIVEALAAGARTLYPVGSIEDALRLANTIGRAEVLLCGERKCLPIEGFDLGNSPREFTPETVAGKTLVMSTTNGTIAISAAVAGERVLIGSWLNFTAVVDDLVRTGTEPVFLCAGRERQFGLEDAVCAGALAAALTKARPEVEWVLNDAAVAAISLAKAHPDQLVLFPQTAAGRGIVEAGLEPDLAFCAQLDVHDAVPVLNDRQLTLATSSTATTEA